VLHLVGARGPDPARFLAFRIFHKRWFQLRVLLALTLAPTPRASCFQGVLKRRCDPFRKFRQRVALDPARAVGVGFWIR